MFVTTDYIPENIYKSLQSIEPDDSWIKRNLIIQTYKSVEDGLDDDCLKAKNSLDSILSELKSISDHTQATTRLIQSWHDGQEQFSTTSMIVYVINKFGFQESSDQNYINAMLMAGILADVKNDLPYHNTLHYRKVLLHVIRMIAAHNMMFQGTGNIIDAEAIAKLSISACIHDLGHQGNGNIIDRKYHMAKTERRSFDLAYPYLLSAGLTDDILSEINTMLIATDTSPMGDPISPANQARTAYEFHFGMESDEEPELTDELSVLREDSRLCLLCVMLHEADIMNSAGVNYDITCEESIAISKELGSDRALPEDTLLFLEKICNGEMLSDSARLLADKNLQDIMNRVMDDYHNGNKSYI